MFLQQLIRVFFLMMVIASFEKAVASEYDNFSSSISNKSFKISRGGTTSSSSSQESQGSPRALCSLTTEHQALVSSLRSSGKKWILRCANQLEERSYDMLRAVYTAETILSQMPERTVFIQSIKSLLTDKMTPSLRAQIFGVLVKHPIEDHSYIMTLTHNKFQHCTYSYEDLSLSFENIFFDCLKSIDRKMKKTPQVKLRDDMFSSNGPQTTP